MRVLVWTPFFHPDLGGIESLLADLLPLMRSSNIDFSVVASHGPSDMPDETDFEGISVYRFPFREAVESRQPRQILQLRSRIRELKDRLRPDIVHVHFSDPSVFFHLETSRDRAASTIVTLHQDYRAFGIQPEFQSLLTKTLSAASWVTGVSARTLEGAAPFLADDHRNTSVIYNGVANARTFDVKPLSSRQKRIQCVGRMVEHKDFATAIRVLSDLRGSFPQLTLTFAGDGPLEDSLRRQVDNLGLTDRTRFLGRISRDGVLAALSEATLLLMPSLTEAFPMTVLEAGNAGRPVVATDVGGVREAVEHGITGIVVPSGDYDGLVEGVASLLSSPDSCTSMGAAARDRVLRDFTLELTAQKYVALYRHVAEDSIVA